MRDGFQIFVADGGKIAQLDAAVFRGGRTLPAIDGDLVAASGQTRRQLFGKRFEPAVARRNSAGTQNGHPHAYPGSRFATFGSGLFNLARCAPSLSRSAAAPAGSLVRTKTNWQCSRP